MSSRRGRPKSGGYITYARSQQGSGHMLRGTVCQDSSSASVNNGLVFAAVCDGHGGADYIRSDRGSRLAVQAVRECVSDKALLAALAASSPRETDALLQQLKKSIVGRWLELTEADLSAEPFSDDELAGVSESARQEYMRGFFTPAYGTTMLFTIICGGFWLAMQLGDGTCAVLSDNDSFCIPLPPDQRCRGNITTSMCDEDAVSEIRDIFSRNIPAAVFLSSDGVENSFSDNEALFSFYTAVCRSFCEDDAASAERQLSEFLPTLSEKGSSDDVSVAFCLDRSRFQH